MFVKKIFCCLMAMLLFASVCTVSAERVDTTERQVVEFKAFVPDGLTAPIHIELVDKKENIILDYYLYDVNNYFNNDSVVLGNYTVKVSVANAKEGDFNFIYDKELRVQKDTVAIPFTIIIDDASLNEAGDNHEDTVSKEISSIKESIKETASEFLSEDTNSASSSDNVVLNDADNEAKEDNVSEIKDEETAVFVGSSNVSMIISLIFSVLLIAGAAVVYWIVKKRNL